MAKPMIHARSSAAKWGGEPEDYVDIHELMDSSKGAFADNRHRALTHNSWFVMNIVERVFGRERVNSEGKTYSTRDVAEQHCVEDFGGYIPSVQDYLGNMAFQNWMGGGQKDRAPSQKKIPKPVVGKGFKFDQSTKD